MNFVELWRSLSYVNFVELWGGYVKFIVCEFVEHGAAIRSLIQFNMSLYLLRS